MSGRDRRGEVSGWGDRAEAGGGAQDARSAARVGVTGHMLCRRQHETEGRTSCALPAVSHHITSLSLVLSSRYDGRAPIASLSPSVPLGECYSRPQRCHSSSCLLTTLACRLPPQPLRLTQLMP